MSDCIFCKIVSGDIPCFRIYEDEDTIAFMDINPANRGHALAIPKIHAENLFAIPEPALAATLSTAKRVAGGIQASLEPHGINLVQANGPGAAQSVFHFHVHIMPRYENDDLMLNWGMNPGDMDEIGALGKQIASSIQ